MTRRFFLSSLDLVATILLAGGAIALVAMLPGGSEARSAAALIFGLLLPGYAFLAAVYPDRGIEFAARLALSLGLSVALLGLLGLVLNWFGSGLDLTNWCIGLGVLTIGLAIVGLVRRGRGSGPKLFSISYVWFGLAAVPVTALAIVATILSSNGAKSQPQPGFSVLGTSIAKDGRARAIVMNHEQRPQRYRLRAVDGGRDVGAWERRLRAGQSWSVPIEAGDPGGEVEVRLFEGRQRQPSQVVELPSPSGSDES